MSDCSAEELLGNPQRIKINEGADVYIMNENEPQEYEQQGIPQLEGKNIKYITH